MTIGQAIGDTRRLKGMTQIQLEAATGIKREYLSKIENGQLENPTIKTLKAIASALGVTASGLLAQTENGNAPASAFNMTPDELNRLKVDSQMIGARRFREVALAAISGLKVNGCSQR